MTDAVVKRFALCFEAVRAFGVEWRREQYVCDRARFEPQADGQITIFFESDVRLERAEWWRRLGYGLFRHVVRGG